MLKRVPPEEQGSEKSFPGFILLHVSGMNQKLLGALEEVYPFKGRPPAARGRKRARTEERSAASVPQAQLEQMMRACEPRVVSDEAFAEMQAEKKAREAAEAAEGGKEGSLEAAMGTLEVASPDEVGAPRDAAAATPRRRRSRRRSARRPPRPPARRRWRCTRVRSRGSRGTSPRARDDGSGRTRRATIFGRETAVSLEASEFAFS